MKKKIWLLLLLIAGLSFLYIKRTKKDIEYISAE
jgi:hypothetical protein